MNNKECTNFFGTVETKRVLRVDYPSESSSLGVPIPIQKNEELNLEVDQSDVLHGLELAEMNAYGGESLLEDFNFDDNIFPLDSEISETLDTDELISLYLVDHVVNTSPVNIPSSSKSGFQLSPNSFSSHSSLSPDPTNSMTLQELLKKETKSQNCLYPPIFGSSVPGSEYMLASKSRENLSQSAPTHLGFDQIWQRREPRLHLLSTGSTSSLSTGVLTSDACEFHLDDTDDNIEPESDNDSEDSDYSGKSVKYKDTFFWQYNVQSKGPKSQRLVLKCKLQDPHCLNKVTDPVFSPNCPIKGIKHSGKARKGDGNDLKPNPKKLLSIGRELNKLNKSIIEMTPTNELPVHERLNARKEKSKLTSRACRLKKKAQHQANKIKLFGLETEHRHLVKAIALLKQILVASKTSDSFPKESQELTNASQKIVKYADKLKVAGRTTEFVNEVLERSKLGIRWGGLNQL